MMISRENIKKRADMYRLLSRFFSREADAAFLEQLETIKFPAAQGPLGTAYARLNGWLAARGENALEELAVDYAGALLAAGTADGRTAIPCASLYTGEGIFMGEAWAQAKAWYDKYGLTVAQEDIMADHLATELAFMAQLCETADAAQQLAFLQEQLLSWLPLFHEALQRHARTDFYRAAGEMTLAYAEMEKELLTALTNGEVQTSRSYSVRQERFDRILARLKEKYKVYAPVRFPGRGSKGRDLIRYGEIGTLTDIVYKERSHFSPKEVFYPVSRTMFAFEGDACREILPDGEKGIIIICRACDIHALRQLDDIFLRNGEPDVYYAKVREKLKLIVLECAESFENCFCASLGSNVAEGYAAAISIDDICAKMEICDSELLPYFADEVEIDFAPRFVQKNPRKLQKPEIARSQLGAICAMDYWKRFDDECIACGGCNAVCPTCACFDTVDVIYDEQSLSGERRRVWSGCMLRDFSQTAGGGMARKTQGANMRYKLLHKFFDHAQRFGGESMCVGCGRCIDRCPKGIDFLDTVNSFAEVLEKEEA